MRGIRRPQSIKYSKCSLECKMIQKKKKKKEIGRYRERREKEKEVPIMA
jgi:hypothetical protein